MKKILTLLMFSIFLMGTCPVATAQVRKRTTSSQVRKRTTSTAKKTTSTVKKSTTTKTAAKPAVKPTPQPVDLGLSVKWSDVDLDAATSTSAGSLYARDVDVAAKLGEGWRLPSADEFQELKDNCTAAVLVKNNVPTGIVFTSKKNGAKIKFYFAPVPVKTSSGQLTNPITGNNGVKRYLINYWDSNSTWNCVTCANTRQASSSLWQQMQSLVNKLGLSKTKYSEWPEEALAQMPDGFFFSDELEYFGSFTTKVEAAAMSGELTIRPVYAPSDDDE